MKKILLAILVLISVQSFGQAVTRKYFERLNTNSTFDSGYVKIPGDSVFNYSGNTFICRTKEYYESVGNPEIPNSFSNFFLCADGVYRNYSLRSQAVLWSGIENKPSAINNATTTGLDLLTLSTPASSSIVVATAAGNAVTRTVSEIKQDLSLNNVDNTSDASKPVSTAQQTALNLKQDISTNAGGWTVLRVSGSNATTTGQALVDITGLVTGTLTNSTKYEIEVLLDVGTSAVTTGTQYAVQTGGSGTAGVVSAIMQGTTTVNAVTQVTLSAPNAAQGTFLTTSGTSGIIRITGFITTRGSGIATISIQHLKVTSGTSTVRIGSVLRYRLAQ